MLTNLERHLATTGDGRRFWYADEGRARALAERTAGTYHGLQRVPVDALPPTIRREIEDRATADGRC